MGFWYLFVKNKKEWLYDDVEEKNIISFICRGMKIIYYIYSIYVINK